MAIEQVSPQLITNAVKTFEHTLETALQALEQYLRPDHQPDQRVLGGMSS